jgi:hypothetical protein
MYLRLHYELISYSGNRAQILWKMRVCLDFPAKAVNHILECLGITSVAIDPDTLAQFFGGHDMDAAAQ